MRIEQGVKVVGIGDKELTVNLNEHYVRGDGDNGYIVHKATKENTLKIIAITIDNNPEIAIKIAKALNEDLNNAN